MISDERGDRCDVCRAYWSDTRRYEAQVAIVWSEEYRTNVAWCRECGTYWDERQGTYPVPISEAQAVLRVPWLAGE